MKLTSRETDLVAELLKGHSNKQIAQALNVSVGTVKMMLHLLYTKTNTANRTELALRCAARVPPPEQVAL